MTPERTAGTPTINRPDSVFLFDRMKANKERYDQGMKLDKTPFPDMQLLGLSPAEIKRVFPEHLQQQLEKTMDLYSIYNARLPEAIRRSERSINFVRHFFASFLVDRNGRAEEVKEGKYEEVVEKSKGILPTPTFFVICMDGRVKIIHIAGLSARTSSAIRTPGGLLNEFIRVDGVLKLDPDSTYAHKLLEGSKRAPFTTQVFDSHYKCAARGREEAATWNKAADSGLFRDVVHKKEMVKATTKFLEAQGDGKNVLLLQTSFNPITGYMYMGLETDAAIKYAQERSVMNAQGKGKNLEVALKYAEFTKEVIKDLINEGKIISTGDLITNPTIKQAFEENWFQLNREDKFVEDSKAFFDKIGNMLDKLYPTLKKEVIRVYPNLSRADERSQIELRERAVLLLLNAFNTYLNNKNHNEIAYLEMTDEQYEEEEHYKYGEHTEEGVKVSEGGHPPYDIPMFVIYSEDVENLSDRIELSSQLVRGNRDAKRVKDTSGQYTDPEEFAMAPVPVIMQEIIRNEKSVKIEKHDWEKLEQIDWTDLPRDWDTMPDNEFNEYLIGKGLTDFLLIKGIEKLRRKMARIYNPTQETSSHLKDMYKLVLPIVCDENRQTHAIIPFLKVAREHNGNGNLPKAA